MQERSTLERDIALIQRIDAVPRILATVAEITGMRFTAVARVTETRWTACAVRDELGFGLAAGGDLELETTICNEIRQHRQPVIFGKASAHPVFATHHTPRIYGLQSYAAVPIHGADGEFFGTLCAVDSHARDLDPPGILRSLELFAELIGAHMQIIDDLDRARLRLQHAESRERMLTTADQDIRDLLQPLMTTLYLLQGSQSLAAADRRLVDDMDESCRQVAQRLRERLELALMR